MSLRTAPGCVAVPEADRLTAPPSLLDQGYAIVVTPATTLPAARPARAVAVGTFPCWLVQTDNRGAERCRLMVTSAAPIYLARGTGERWFLLAGSQVAAGTDAAFDVTIGDEAGDWIETASAPAAARLPIDDTRIVVGAGQLINTVGGCIEHTFTTPAGARTVQVGCRMEDSAPLAAGVLYTAAYLVDSTGRRTQYCKGVAVPYGFDNAIAGENIAAQWNRLVHLGAGSGAGYSGGGGATYFDGTSPPLAIIARWYADAGAGRTLLPGKLFTTRCVWGF